MLQGLTSKDLHLYGQFLEGYTIIQRTKELEWKVIYFFPEGEIYIYIYIYISYIYHVKLFVFFKNQPNNINVQKMVLIVKRIWIQRLEWLSIYRDFQKPYCLCVCVLSHSVVANSVTPWTVAQQAPLFMGILQARISEWVAMPTLPVCLHNHN